jgi:predicted XRE-type DNA-binding protein
MIKGKVCARVSDAFADMPEPAANLRARAELMRQIATIVKKSGWTQTEAAQRRSVTQPRMSNLFRGRVSGFSLEALVNSATALGRRVHVEVDAA